MFPCSGRRRECNLFTISSVNFELKQGKEYRALQLLRILRLSLSLSLSLSRSLALARSRSLALARSLSLSLAEPFK